MKPGKTAGPSGVGAEMISASGDVGISVMLKLCRCVLNGNGVLDEWLTSVLVLISKKM